MIKIMSPALSAILTYLKFFSSYLLTGLVILLLGGLFGLGFSGCVTLLMPLGAAVMIFTLVRIYKKKIDLEVATFYYAHLAFTFLVLTVGVILEKTSGFVNQTEFTAEDGMRNVVFSNSIIGDIYTILSQAFIFSCLILIVNAMRIKKVKTILIAIASFLILTGYFILID
jgi:hypothetical protein